MDNNVVPAWANTQSLISSKRILMKGFHRAVDWERTYPMENNQRKSTKGQQPEWYVPHEYFDPEWTTSMVSGTNHPRNNHSQLFLNGLGPRLSFRNSCRGKGTRAKTRNLNTKYWLIFLGWLGKFILFTYTHIVPRHSLT